MIDGKTEVSQLRVMSIGVQANLTRAKRRLKSLEEMVEQGRIGRAAQSGRNTELVDAAIHAMSTISRLKNYEEISDTVDSSHDFIVPLYNAQGKNKRVNAILSKTVQTILSGEIAPGPTSRVKYVALFEGVEGKLNGIVKEVHDNEPAERMKFDTQTLPSLVKNIQLTQMALAKLERANSSCWTKIEHHSSYMPQQIKMHSRLLKKFKHAKFKRATNVETCTASMKAFSVATTRRRKMVREIESTALSTAAQYAIEQKQKAQDAHRAAVRAATEGSKAWDGDAVNAQAMAAKLCPANPSCDGTIAKPCRLPWKTVRGGELCLWSVTIERRQEQIYQQPGWMPVYPACIHGDSIGCALRNKAELSTIQNPKTQDVAEYNSLVLSKHVDQNARTITSKLQSQAAMDGAMSIASDPKAQHDSEALKQSQVVCKTLTKAELLVPADKCYVPGCGISVSAARAALVCIQYTHALHSTPSAPLRPLPSPCPILPPS
jgi:hypothetical protein